MQRHWRLSRQHRWPLAGARTVMGENTWCRSLLRLSYTTDGDRWMVTVERTPVKKPSAEYGSVCELGGGGCSGGVTGLSSRKYKRSRVVLTPSEQALISVSRPRPRREMQQQSRQHAGACSVHHRNSVQQRRRSTYRAPLSGVLGTTVQEARLGRCTMERRPGRRGRGPYLLRFVELAAREAVIDLQGQSGALHQPLQGVGR